MTGGGGQREDGAGTRLLLPIGPLRFQVALDAALAPLVPDAWRSARAPGCAPAHDALVLAPLLEPLAPDDARHGFDAEGRLVSARCRLVRTGPGAHALTRGQTAADLPALTRAVRFASQPALLAHGWLLLHGSSVRLGAGAHVFVARSGTGKSTLARRLQDAGEELLGDEVALVAPGTVGVHPGQLVHGPLGAEHPLAAVHLLVQGEPQIQPLSPAQALGRLLEAAMVYEDGPAAARRALDVAAAIVAGTPVFETHVPNDARATALVRSTSPSPERR